MSDNQEITQLTPGLSTANEVTEVVAPVKAVAAEAPGVKLIKRYRNRKLYDTEISKYITLKDLYAYIQEGSTIKVINDQNQEITSTIFLAALTEQCKGLNNNDIADLLEFATNYFRGGLNG